MKTIYKFKNFNYNINNTLTVTDIGLALDEFYVQELLNIDPKLKFCIIFKIKTLDGNWRNVSSLQILDKSHFSKLKLVFSLFLDVSVYKGIRVDKIVFKYRYLESEIAPKEYIFKNPTDFYMRDEVLPLGYYNLPNNRLFECWGDSILIYGDNTYLVEKDNSSFFIRKIDNEYFISFMLEGIEVLYFQDIYDPQDKTNNTFIRIIDNTELYYCNGMHYILNTK